MFVVDSLTTTVLEQKNGSPHLQKKLILKIFRSEVRHLKAVGKRAKDACSAQRIYWSKQIEFEMAGPRAIPLNWHTQPKPLLLHSIGRRFAAASLPRLFGKNPRSHHKGATNSFQLYAIANLDKTSLQLLKGPGVVVADCCFPKRHSSVYGWRVCFCAFGSGPGLPRLGTSVTVIEVPSPSRMTRMPILHIGREADASQS